MAQYGVNVPPGIPVFKLDDVLPAAEKMADDSGQVICSSLAFSTCQVMGHLLPHSSRTTQLLKLDSFFAVLCSELHCCEHLPAK